MARIPHTEKHFSSSETVRDIVIGMSDGLTVPFALAAGLTGAVSNAGVILTAGLAEIAAGSIAMGLGGYLAARGDAEHYASERRREEREVETMFEQEKQEVREIFEGYGLTAQECQPLVDALASRPKDFVDFMMRFELTLEEPDPRRAWRSALTIAGSYIVGGLVPLSPYMFDHNINHALMLSCTVTLLALLLFGYAKGHFTGTHPWRGALQTAFIGGAAAGAAFGIARAIQAG